MKRWRRFPSCQTPFMANGTIPSSLGRLKLIPLFFDESLVVQNGRNQRGSCACATQSLALSLVTICIKTYLLRKMDVLCVVIKREGLSTVKRVLPSRIEILYSM